jgi:hypothetical protein
VDATGAGSGGLWAHAAIEATQVTINDERTKKRVFNDIESLLAQERP